MLTSQQYKECMDVYNNKDPFEHLLLDEREPNGRIITVLEYDEETIMIQTVVNGEFDYIKIPLEEFINYGKGVQ